MIRMRSQRVNNFFAKNFSRYQPLIALIVSDLPRARQNVRFRSFPNHRTLLYQRLKIGILRRKVAKLQSGDVVICAQLDRMFRSALDAVETVDEFKDRGIRLLVLDLAEITGDNTIVISILAAV